MPGFIGYSLKALALTRHPAPLSWCAGVSVAWGASFALNALEMDPVLRLAIWMGLLALATGLWLGRYLHPVLLFPILSMAGATMAVASVLSLGSGYEAAIDALTARTQGDAMVSRRGRDFHEYPKVARGLEALPEVAVALPFVHVEGLAQVRSKKDGRAISSAMVLRGVAPESLRKSRIFAAARKAQALHAPLPADRDRPAQLWMGMGLARRLGAQIGQPIVLSVWAREAIRDEAGLRYEYGVRERRFVLSAIFESADRQLDDQLVVSALSAAQALAHGRAWVSGIDLEWSERSAQRESSALELVEAWLTKWAPLCQVSSWRESPERDQQRRRFLALSAVLSFGLMSAATVSVVLGVMILLRLRANFFRVLYLMGAHTAQLRAVLAALIACALLASVLLFAFWWKLLAYAAPALSFSMEVLGELKLNWMLSGFDLLWILIWITVSFLLAYLLLSRQVEGGAQNGAGSI